MPSNEPEIGNYENYYLLFYDLFLIVFKIFTETEIKKASPGNGHRI